MKEKTIEEAELGTVYAWLRYIDSKYPPYDVSKHVPLSVRYRHLSIKVLWRTDLEDIMKMPTTDELLEEGKLIEEEGKFLIVGSSPSPV